ncbi:MAG: hypothetical protein Kow0031_01160 [Anaerolineae bacterium]
MTTGTAAVTQQTIFNVQLAVTSGGAVTPIEATKKQVARLLRERGYRVMPARRNRAYLWYTDGERVVGIEVHRAAGRQDKKGRYTRYQSPVLGHDQAQVLLLLAVAPDGQEHPFFIPMSAIGQRRNIAIWSDPVEYNGQWAPYRHNWDVLDQALAEAPSHDGWGLTLFK